MPVPDGSVRPPIRDGLDTRLVSSAEQTEEPEEPEEPEQPEVVERDAQQPQQSQQPEPAKVSLLYTITFSPAPSPRALPAYDASTVGSWTGRGESRPSLPS
jgi:hypothetical protein